MVAFIQLFLSEIYTFPVYDRKSRDLMPMTHTPEIWAENRHQKTGTINRHENTAFSYSLPETAVPENLVRNCMSDAPDSKNRYRFSGTDFW